MAPGDGTRIWYEKLMTTIKGTKIFLEKRWKEKYNTKRQKQKKKTKKYDIRESWGQVYHFADLKRT